MTFQILTLPFDMAGHSELRIAAVTERDLVGVCNLVNVGRIACTISQLFVAPAWRGKGAGTALVNRACSEAALHGATACAAIVDENGPVGFWSMNGFLPVHCEGRQTLVAKQLE